MMTFSRHRVSDVRVQWRSPPNCEVAEVASNFHIFDMTNNLRSDHRFARHRKPKSVQIVQVDLANIVPVNRAVAELAGLNLPAGSELVIVPNALTWGKGRKRNSAGQRMFSLVKSRSRVKRSTQASIEIDESAFRPGARAIALLQGVKLAQASLKDAGGAFNLE